MKAQVKWLCILAVLYVLPFRIFAAGQQEQIVPVDGNTLSVYHYLDQTDKTTAPNFQALVDVFYEETPGIHLEFEYGYGEAYHNKLQMLAVSGQLPDIVLLYPGKRTSQVTGAGLVKDLRPWLADHESEFAPMAMLPQGDNGEIWELPEDISVTSIMYTNNRLMKELGLTLPKTFDELVKQGDLIRSAGYTPISLANKDAWPMQSCLESMLVERTGGMTWYKSAVDGAGASFRDPEFIQSLKLIKQMYDKEMFSPGINQLAYMQGLDDFVNERAVYFIDGGWMVNNLVGELSNDQKSYISLESFPDVPGQKGQSGSVAATAGQGFGMNAKLTNEEAEAAWKWIWFYAGPKGSAIRQKYGRLPAYLLNTPEDADTMIKKLISFVGNVPMGYVLDSVIGSEAIGKFNVSLQEMMYGLKTPEQVADELEQLVEANDRK